MSWSLRQTGGGSAPDYVVIKAADEFTDKTTAINQMWQTDFTYFKIIALSWFAGQAIAG
jgi:hypothetical protein